MERDYGKKNGENGEKNTPAKKEGGEISLSGVKPACCIAPPPCVAFPPAFLAPVGRLRSRAMQARGAPRTRSNAVPSPPACMHSGAGREMREQPQLERQEQRQQQSLVSRHVGDRRDDGSQVEQRRRDLFQAVMRIRG